MEQPVTKELAAAFAVVIEAGTIVASTAAEEVAE